MKKLVIIPTYNERENVSRMISKVMSLFGGYDLLIVDDGSPDGTAAIVRGRQEEFPGRVHLIERAGNWDWERPTSRDSGGHWHTVTIWFTRWTATFRTTPTIWNG